MKCFRLLTLISLLAATAAWGADYRLSLDESIRLGLENSPELRQAEELENEYREKITEARAGLLPSLDMSARYTRLDVAPYISMDRLGELLPGGEDTPSKITVGDEDNYEIVGTVTQPLFTGMRLKNGYDAARESCRAVENDYLRVKNELILQIKTAWYNLHRARQSRRIADESLELIEAHLEDVRNLFEEGMVLRNEVLKTEVHLSNARYCRLQADNAVQLAMAAFCEAAGLPIGSEVELSGEVEFEPAPAPATAEEARFEALEGRPEIWSLRDNINALDKSVSMSRGAYWPQVALIYNYNFIRPNREYEPEFYRSWDLSLAVELPLFDWGRRSSRVQQAQARKMQAAARLENTREKIALQVEQAVLELENARQRVELATETVAQAEENYRVTSESFREGMVSNTDFLDADIALTTARLNRLEAVTNYKLAVSELEYVTGEQVEDYR